MEPGHGIDLHTVHRFLNDWEGEASLGLRRGDPNVLETYADQGRLHAHADVEDAVEALHERWARERAAGWNVLMMARTRVDVEALNHRARASALDAGEVHGPAVRLGERDWQEGDLLRTRRNDRGIEVGEAGHVRNGDRYRVVAVDESGLRVEHLDRGELAFLPAAYVAAHGEYGWATTVTAAQGATVQIGLVLVRPGIDREHLYVGMTRGNWANHAFVATDGDGSDRHGPAGERPGGSEAVDVLAAALARSGAQDAAHTARDSARNRAVEAVRRAAEEAARRAAEPTVPDEHVARAAELIRRRDQRARLAEEQQRHSQAAAKGREELAGTGRLRSGRRQERRDVIARHDYAVNAGSSRLWHLDREIEALSRRVALDGRSWEAQKRAHAARPIHVASDESHLAPARPGPLARRPAPAQTPVVTRGALEQQHAAELRRRPVRNHSYGRHRDDGPGIGL